MATTFTYTISDGTREATGVITLNFIPRLVANPEEISVEVGQTMTFDPKLNDAGPPGFRIVAVTQPAGALVEITEDNQLRVTAA